MPTKKPSAKDFKTKIECFEYFKIKIDNYIKIELNISDLSSEINIELEKMKKMDANVYIFKPVKKK